jgi:hypothetical protein
VKKFMDNAWQCFAGDFLLASRQLWESVWGFNEIPANLNVDAVFLAKFLKLIPGYARFFIHPITIHQWHEANNWSGAAVRNVDVVMEEIACVGESKSLGKNFDIYKWGQLGEEFREVRI